MKVNTKIVSGTLVVAVMGLLAWPYASGQAEYRKARAGQRHADACEIGTELARKYERIGLTALAEGWRSTAEADCSIGRLQALK